MSNSLGLDFENMKIVEKDVKPLENGAQETPAEEASAQGDPESKDIQGAESGEQPTEPAGDVSQDVPPGDKAASDSKEKKKPYVNPDRVNTGGPQRDKLSEDELTERMTRIREQNEKIKARRLDVKADEDAFKKTQEAERAKLAKTRKVQEQIDRTREQNAQRKMEKVQSREWDSGKKTNEWKSAKQPAEDPTKDSTESDGAAPSSPNRGWSRGGRGRGRGRGDAPGRGRGRGTAEAKDAKIDAPATETTPSTPAEPVPAS